MANGTLSSYFKKEKAKGTKAGGVSPYSAPVEPTGGSAPTGGGSSPSAPKAAQGGGTGFVSFGQYFGGNAPAVQAQAQKQAVSAKGFEELNALQKSGGVEGGAFDTMLGGGETKRQAAKQGQYRFQQLGARLGEGRPDMTMGGKAIEQSSAVQAANAKNQALNSKAQEIYGNYGNAALDRPWNELSDAEKQPYLDDAKAALGY